MLLNAVWGGRVSDFPEKSARKMYGSTLLGYEGVAGCRISRKKALHNTLMAPNPEINVYII